VELRWVEPDTTDGSRDLDRAAAVLEAARELDSPHELGTTVAQLRADLVHGWDGDPPRVALVENGDGRAVAVLTADRPRWDNTHIAFVQVIVDPAARRQGVGRWVMETAAELARADGRTTLMTDSWDRPDRRAFAAATGLHAASNDVERRQDLLSLDRARLQRVEEEAEPYAGGYELLRVPLPVPDELMDQVVRMTAAINDAPTDDLDVEDEVFSPERVRAFEDSQRAHGRRVYRLVARERSTGELAGHTVVGLESDRPWRAGQWDTSVLATHRGHRLGLLLKAGMLRWLAEAEPQLRVLDTWNSASNTPMVRVNEDLGYQVLARGITWQRTL
jgi:GNAT superfamily N-acetyltransferase